jgi:8-oxo-(d)GTP phosphatase
MKVILLRHAWAGDRDAWTGDDHVRPLDERGWAQARELRDLLHSHGISRVISSPAIRCTQTVEPLDLPVETDERLAEGADVEDTLALLRGLDGVVVCTHGDVIESIIGRELEKGGAVVLHRLELVDEIDAP